MKIVVPLAGPDFERSDGGVKATLEIKGRPLLRRALETRQWWLRGQVGPADMIFVLRDTPASQAFAQGPLHDWYPEAGIVSIGRYTRGAALSALAGVALMEDQDEPICVDLADIEYRTALDPLACFARAPRPGGIVLTFPSDNPAYSYLRTDDAGRVVEAVEKRVISNAASAGTYFFGDTASYLTALAHSLAHADAVTHRDLFFVCPLVNGLVAHGRDVLLEEVTDVADIKMTA
jgi:hypothetical protein